MTRQDLTAGLPSAALSMVTTIQSPLRKSYGGHSAVTVTRGEVDERVLTDDPVGEVSRQFAGGGVTGVRVERPDLETVFLSLTGRSLRE